MYDFITRVSPARLMAWHYIIIIHTSEIYLTRWFPHLTWNEIEEKNLIRFVCMQQISMISARAKIFALLLQEISLN